MTTPSEASKPVARPNEREARRRAEGEGTTFRIQELQALLSSLRSVFILMFVLTLAILTYIALRVFVLRDVRSYGEFFGLCFFSLACVALCLGQLYCLRHIRHEACEKIERMTFTDELTGVYNYRFLDQRLQQEIHRAKRHGSSLSVVYFDIDRFKQVNDTYGHETGNRVLERVGQTCRVSARGEDFVGRLGGDEFLLVLPETESSGALIAAERVNKKLNALELVAPDGNRIDFLGYSMGVASFPANGQAAVDLIRAADHAMYRAKKSGGNRVCL